MRTCESCGRQNADDVDFCTCGEYLRWEPTSHLMPAVAPPSSRDAVDAPPAATEAEPQESEEAPLPPSPAAKGAGFVSAVLPALPPRPPTPSPEPEPSPTPGARQGSRPQPSPVTGEPPSAHEAPAGARPAPDGRGAPSASAAVSLRLPDDEPGAGAGTLGVAVAPGGRVRVVAHVRNQSTIVDNYTLVVHGLPREWYTLIPETVYLVPFGSQGAYEQEVEIQLHPPRSPEAEARRWPLSVGVVSRAEDTEVASAAMTLGIHPYEDYKVDVRPQRASGRRRAKYDVRISNDANAVAHLALDAKDGDDACRFDFERDTVEVGLGETKAVPLRCHPPRQIWLGRPVERRIEIACASGEEGEKLLEARRDAAEGQQGGLSPQQGKAPALTGVSAPKVDAPGLSLGPSGKPDVRMPNLRGPHFQGVNLRRPTLGLRSLRMPAGAAGSAAPSAPLLPTQAVFRQKPWLPWWLAIVVPLLALLALLLVLLLPDQVTVPDVRGSESVFAAQTHLTEAGLALGDRQENPSKDVTPGTVVNQSPVPGADVEKGSAVAIEIAVGNGEATVPKLAGLTFGQADKELRSKGLTKGAVSVNPPDLEAKIERTVPGAGERVKVGSAVDLFYPEPAEGEEPGGAGGGEAVGGEAGGGEAGGGGAGRDVEVPKIDPADQPGYAAVLAKAGLVAGKVEPRIGEAAPGTVLGTDPPVGTKVPKGTKITLLVSAPFPRLAYDEDRNVLLADSAIGETLSPALAETERTEKDPTWSPDGRSIVYTADGQLMRADMTRRSRRATALRSASERYADPSFAPTTRGSVLAVVRIDKQGRKLCVGRVAKRDDFTHSFTPKCIADDFDDFKVGFAHWSADGRTILVPGVDDKGFGIVQYTSKRAFSPRASDWGKGKFVTPRAPNKGVVDVALSPNGKRLAAIANLETPVPQLYLTTPDDIGLRKAEPLPVPACKVAWLDSAILALVKLGDACDQPVGEIMRINVGDPTSSTPLVTAGDNPTFQPLSAGG